MDHRTIEDIGMITFDSMLYTVSRPTDLNSLTVRKRFHEPILIYVTISAGKLLPDIIPLIYHAILNHFFGLNFNKLTEET